MLQGGHQAAGDELAVEHGRHHRPLLPHAPPRSVPLQLSAVRGACQHQRLLRSNDFVNMFLGLAGLEPTTTLMKLKNNMF